MSEFRKSLTAIAVTAGSLAAAIGASSAAQADTAHGASAMASSVAPLPKPGLPAVSNGPIYAQTTSGFGPVGGGGTAMPCDPVPHLVAWSPDGSRLACINRLSQGMLRIWSADGAIASAGSVTGQQAGTALNAFTGMTWFNHGTEIVLVQNGSLVTVRADGSQPRNADQSYTLTPLLPGQSGIGDLSSDASGNLLLFTQNYVSGTHVMLYDRTKPAGSALQTLTQLSNAATPALSPDGRYIAYTVFGPQGSNTAAQIWLYDLQSPASASNPRQLTTDTTTHHIEPHWSPDGTRIAYQASTVGQPSVSTASFAVTNPSAQNTEIPNSLTGTYAWRPLTTKPVERLAGTDRIGTSVAVSQAAWESAGANGGRRTAKSVTLSRSDLFADALGGAGFAAHQQGPLLLTEPTKLNPATLAELQRVLGPGAGATGPTVYLLGGESALSPAVKNALAALNYNVVRLGGLNRFQTAVTIAKQDSGSTPNKVLVATGRNYPDALAAGAAAGANPNTVVVLTDDGTMPPETAAYLNGLSGATIYGVGGQAVTALAGRTAIPLKGVDRIDTSLLVARNLFDTPQSVGFATSTNWPDSLAGGALQGTVGGPLLLVAPSGLSPDEMTYMVDAASSVESAQIYGGAAAVPAIENRVGTEIGGSAGFVVK